ncbi:MAG: dihydropteridine reductase [Ruminococcaceae bacterium]|nr:dihydropteridine reductase [Oscillospiraceae bacterium]
MNKNDQEFIIQKIRSQYTEKEDSRLKELKRLDSKVKRPPLVFAYIFGIIGAIIMGGGMSLSMSDFSKVLGILENIAFALGIIIGIVGIVLVSLAYPLYNRILKKEREKRAPEIIRLTDELMK